MKFSKVLRSRFEGMTEEREARAAGEDPHSVIPTGLREFDKRGGHKRKIVTLYGAATGEGKSIWKLHLMTAAAQLGYTVTVLDFEDPEERTADRAFSRHTLINNAKMMSGDLTDSELNRIKLALKASEEWADNIEFQPGLRTADEALEVVEEYPADLVLVDYLQGLPHGKGGREQAISDFMWSLTKWCQDNDSAGVAFSQVVTEVEQRGLRMYEAQRRRDPEGQPYIDGFRPFASSDLAWCSDAGKVAKELGFLFRPGRYLKRFGVQSKDDVMEVAFPKRNFGGEGVIKVGFDGPHARMYDLPEKGK